MKIIFKYEAVIASGEVIQGSFQGTKEEFELMLQKKKLLLTSIEEIKEKVDNSKFTQDNFLAFIEELYYLTKSGMPIDKAIKVLSQTTKKVAYRRILKTILEELKAGGQLSVALKKALQNENITVDSLAISFISTAEEVGSVTTGLYQLFEYLTFQKKIRSDIREALAYPLFLIGMSVVVSFLIFFLIIPRFSTIFSADQFAQLPTISYIVLSTGKFLSAHMSEAFVVIGILIFILIIFIKKININWMSLFYRVPKLSGIILDLQLTIVYSALSTMLTGGLEIDKALKQLQDVSLLPELKNLLKTALFEIKRGQKLSDVFAMSSIIPASDIALLYVGESSASLAEVFKSLSTRHSEAFNTNVKKILSILEPTVIVGLGIFIAIIVVSIMMAVMSMTDMVG